MAMTGDDGAATVDVDGHELQLTHLDKVFYPDPGYTKGEVVDYYRRIASHLVPWVRQRPLVMHRYPEGVDGESFIQKEAPEHFPDWIRRAELPKEGGTTTYVVCDDAATLVYVANQGCLVPHVWPSLVDAPDRPDQLIFDLDPSGPLDEEAVDAVRDGARRLRRVLSELRLAPFVKSSGSRGLHVHVPLDRSADFDEVRRFARAVAEVVVEEAPERFTLAQRKSERDGRLLIDIFRNGYAQHAVAPYGLRAKPEAPVAVPLDWSEATSSSFHPRRYTLGNVFRRLGHKSDPWAGFGRHRGSIEVAARRLGERR